MTSSLCLVAGLAGLFVLAGCVLDQGHRIALAASAPAEPAPAVASSPATVSLHLKPPKMVVSNFRATSGQPGVINLSWTLPARNDYASLTVLVSANGGNTWAPIATIAPTATSYAIKGLDTSIPYSFDLLANAAAPPVRLTDVR